MTEAGDPFNLRRFVEAQRDTYHQALRELRAGRKTSHWMWFVFPQLRGLGMSEASRFYGVAGLDEARAYLAHPVLGARLRECVEATLAIDGLTAEDVLGHIDSKKFRSCLTLFARAAPEEPAFGDALEKLFAGEADERTLTLLREAPK
jgi:uncharacterized protein (DUF1810 family)